MPKKRYKAEEIIKILREADVLISQGMATPRAARQLGITDKTYYRWRKEYGSLSVSQAKRLKEVEKENVQLRKLVSDLSLDKAILKEVAEGKY